MIQAGSVVTENESREHDSGCKGQFGVEVGAVPGIE
jgi:hypothetical protein